MNVDVSIIRFNIKVEIKMFKIGYILRPSMENK